FYSKILVPSRKIRKARVLQEIKHLRRSVSFVLPKAPFARLVKEIINTLFPSSSVIRIQVTALEALQEALEAYIVQFFEDCYLLTMHAKRVTLQINDMFLMRRLRGRDDIINR
ncbi:histone H3-like, partial [Xylocopa sonorina]|uniref:histone H3-like n=1 Tax=Xylocopa sonorina TaxID=1818115 RepID=UPI00403B14A0